MIDFKIECKEFVKLYLFGSAIYSESPTDLDIAIIYEKSSIKIDEIIEYRRELENNLRKQTACEIDTILLNTEEEKEMDFLANAKYREI
jgi:predicted nucleotidyltransferase